VRSWKGCDVLMRVRRAVGWMVVVWNAREVIKAPPRESAKARRYVLVTFVSTISKYR
jgi:hypothetical protein